MSLYKMALNHRRLCRNVSEFFRGMILLPSVHDGLNQNEYVELASSDSDSLLYSTAALLYSFPSPLLLFHKVPNVNDAPSQQSEGLFSNVSNIFQMLFSRFCLLVEMHAKNKHSSVDFRTIYSKKFSQAATRMDHAWWIM